MVTKNSFRTFRRVHMARHVYVVTRKTFVRLLRIGADPSTRLDFTVARNAAMFDGIRWSALPG